MKKNLPLGNIMFVKKTASSDAGAFAKRQNNRETVLILFQMALLILIMFTTNASVSGQSPKQQKMTGTIREVLSGSQIIIQNMESGGLLPVTLYGITAPPENSLFFEVARQTLCSLCAHKKATATIQLVDGDISYATVKVGSLDLSRGMISSGWAIYEVPLNGKKSNTLRNAWEKAKEDKAGAYGSKEEKEKAIIEAVRLPENAVIYWIDAAAVTHIEGCSKYNSGKGYRSHTFSSKQCPQCQGKNAVFNKYRDMHLQSIALIKMALAIKRDDFQTAVELLPETGSSSLKVELVRTLTEKICQSGAGTQELFKAIVDSLITAKSNYRTENSPYRYKKDDISDNINIAAQLIIESNYSETVEPLLSELSTKVRDLYIEKLNQKTLAAMQSVIDKAIKEENAELLIDTVVQGLNKKSRFYRLVFESRDPSTKQLKYYIPASKINTRKCLDALSQTKTDLTKECIICFIQWRHDCERQEGKTSQEAPQALLKWIDQSFNAVEKEAYIFNSVWNIDSMDNQNLTEYARIMGSINIGNPGIKQFVVEETIKRLIEVKLFEAAQSLFDKYKKIFDDLDFNHLEEMINHAKTETLEESMTLEERARKHVKADIDEMEQMEWYTSDRIRYGGGIIHCAYHESGNTFYMIEPYFGIDQKSKTVLFRMRSRYFDVQSKYHDVNWIFYNRIQFLGLENKDRLEIETEYPNKKTNNDSFGLEEWSDNMISEVDFENLMKSKTIMVKFYGKYQKEFQLSKEQYRMFEEILWMYQQKKKSL